MGASLAVVGGLALTACTPEQFGAAAVIEGERLSVTELQETTDGLLEAGGSEGQSPGEAQRVTLSRFIVSEVIEAAAASEGVTVTRGQIDAQRRQIEEALGGADQLAPQLAAQGVAPGHVEQFLRDVTLSDALGRALVPGEDQAVVQQRSLALNDLLLETAAELDVSVNPRYGVWVPEQGTVEGQISGGLARSPEDYTSVGAPESDAEPGAEPGSPPAPPR